MPIPKTIFVPSSNSRCISKGGDESTLSLKKETKLLDRITHLPYHLLAIAARKQVMMDDDEVSELSMKDGFVDPRWSKQEQSDLDSFIELINQHRIAAEYKKGRDRKNVRAAYAA